MLCPNFDNIVATAFGKIGARDGGCNVTEDTRSRRYSYVKLEGPGKLMVCEGRGFDTRFSKACATSSTCK